MSDRVAFLRCQAGKHPDLPLPHGVEVLVGRGPATKVADSRVSRKQLALVADTQKCRVKVKQRGGNSSVVGGKELVKEGEAVGKHGDKVELVKGSYLYSILFSPPPDAERPKSPKEASTTKSSALQKMAGKRVAEEDISDLISKGGKITGDPISKGGKMKGKSGRPWMDETEGRVIHTAGWAEWREIAGGAMIVGTEHGLQGASRVAAFDLDWCVIGTASGKVFPRDLHDWKFLFPEVPGRLKQLIKEGYKVVIISNQSGIQRGKMTVEDWRTKATRIKEKLGIPLQVFCSTRDGGYFRKPKPGIWEWLEKYGNSGVEVDRSKSFYVGDAAGRDAGWQTGKKKDFSCSDRLLALNLKMTFRTPEEEFLGRSPTSKYKLPSFQPPVSCHSLIEPPTTLITTHPSLTLMVGIQGSGKSVIAARLEKEGVVVASNDRTGGKEKTIRLADQGLMSGKSVVVDNTHVDKEARKPFIDLAKKHQVPVRCFLMTTSHDHARHNNIFRELTDPTHTKIKEPLFNQYRSRFVEPSLEEGFDNIFRVNCVPKFSCSEEEELYNMHLLEK